MRTFTLIFLAFILCVMPTLAQDDCPAIVAAALDVVAGACSHTARNQLCYGNITLNATPHDGIGNLQFDQPGDMVAVDQVRALQLSSFSLTGREWGVALMAVQANLPDTLPGQNVTFVLFGNVTLTDASSPVIEMPVTATSGVNVRLRPTTNASVIDSLANGETITADGRLPDSSWVHVHSDETPDGWVSAAYLTGDISRLLVIEPGAPVFGPMQAFYFNTGIGDSPCAEAPSSGILIQTPSGAGAIQLRANDVDIVLGSTVYLQAAPENAMHVYVLEGHARLTAEGDTQLVPAGTVAAVPLDEGGVASGPPGYPEPYATLPVEAIPVELLPDEISITEPLAEDEIDAAIAALIPVAANAPGAGTVGAGPQASGSSAASVYTGTEPPSGRWWQSATVIANTCDPETIEVGRSWSGYHRMIFSEDRSSVVFEFGPGWGPFTFHGSGSTYTYVGPGGGMVWTVTFTSPTTYFLAHRGNYGDPDAGGCIYYQDEYGTYVGG